MKKKGAKGFLSVLAIRVAMYEQYKAMSANTKPTKKQELFRQRLELITYRDEFRGKVSDFRMRFRIPSDGFTDFAECHQWTKKVSAKDSTDYEVALRALLASLGIKARWFEATEYYLLFNKIDAHELLPKSVTVKIMSDAITGETNLCLQISSETEQRDILHEWKTIERFQGIVRSQQGLDTINPAQDFLRKLEKIDPMPHVEKQVRGKTKRHDEAALEKSRRAYLLRQDGKSYKEIGKSVGCDQWQVGTYISRFKQLISKVKLD
jgi:hypothetical protein